MQNWTNFQIEIMQERSLDAIECRAPDERQMTSAADSLYGAVYRAQTVTIQAMAAIPAPLSAAHTLTVLHPVLFVIES